MKPFAPIFALIILSACLPANNVKPTNTPLTLPSPTHFVVITRTPAPTVEPTRTTSPTIDIPTHTHTPIPSPTDTIHADSFTSQSQAIVSSNILAHANAPAALESALRSAGVEDPHVYWFTFDVGDREEALMIQYASPIRFRPGYDDMLLAAKSVAAETFLKIDPPLYTLFIAATDLTGTSDNVLRLRRDAVERWTRGEIGDDEFFNNGFVQAPIKVTCEQSGACSAIDATPFPTFPPFPFPFPTPTP